MTKQELTEYRELQKEIKRLKKRIWKRDKAKKYKWVASPLGFLRVEVRVV